MKEIPQRIEELKENFERSDKKFISKMMIEEMIKLDPFCRLITDEIAIGLKQDYEIFLKSMSEYNILIAFCKYWYYANYKDFQNMLEVIEEHILS